MNTKYGKQCDFEIKHIIIMRVDTLGQQTGVSLWEELNGQVTQYVTLKIHQPGSRSEQ